MEKEPMGRKAAAPDERHAGSASENGATSSPMADAASGKAAPAVGGGASHSHRGSSNKGMRSGKDKGGAARFRHDLPAARPLSEREIEEREARWNGFFSVDHRERALPNPPGSGRAGGASTGGDGAVHVPTPRTARPLEKDEFGSTHNHSHGPMVPATHAHLARSAAREWLSMLQGRRDPDGARAHRHSDGVEERTSGATSRDTSETPRKRAHHLRACDAGPMMAQRPFHPSDPFTIAPVAGKTFDEMASPSRLAAAHRRFVKNGADGGGAAGAAASGERQGRVKGRRADHRSEGRAPPAPPKTDGPETVQEGDPADAS